MKKIRLALISILAVALCSACSVNININTDDKSENAEVVEKTTEPTTVTEKEVYKEPAKADMTKKTESEAFYGVWCVGSKSKSDADRVAAELSGKGFDAQVLVTSDWENLNPEKFYVVTAGMCRTQEEANTLLGSVKQSGYSDAYVKYTGERK